LGSAEQASAEIKAAKAHFEETLRIVETLLKENPSAIEHQNFETEALRRLGDIKLHQGEIELAQRLYDRQLKASATNLAGCCRNCRKSARWTSCCQLVPGRIAEREGGESTIK